MRSSGSCAIRSATAPTGSRSTRITGGARRGEAAPTFSLDELKLIVDTARSSGRPVVAHASTAEGMRRAVLAGVETIEHGDGGTPEVFRLMAERSVALCPTLAAGDAIAQYGGWKKGESAGTCEHHAASAPASRRRSTAGVTILNGSDVGVFAPRRQRARAGADGGLRHGARRAL